MDLLQLSPMSRLLQLSHIFQAAVSNVNCACGVCAQRVPCQLGRPLFTCLLDLGWPGLAMAMASNTGGHLEVDSVVEVPEQKLHMQVMLHICVKGLDATCSTAYTVLVHVRYRCVGRLA